MKVLSELVQQAEAAESELRGILFDGDEPRTELSDEQEKRATELRGEIEDLDKRIKDEKKAAKRAANLAEARDLVKAAETREKADDGTDARVVKESMVYGEGSPHSYFADLSRVVAGMGWGDATSAQERMSTWSHQVEREVAHGSTFGRDAEVQLRGMKGIRSENGAHARQVVEEVRNRGRVALDQKQTEVRAGITTGGGATASSSGGGGAALVTPVFFVNDTAPYREAGRAFIDQCNRQPLPEYGMNIYMPQVTAKAGVASQTEGSGVNESDPTLGYLSAGLSTYAGQVTVTQQLLDRVGPNFQFDRLIFDQLQRDYNPQVDTAALTTALGASAGQVVFGGSWAFNTFVSKIAGAINNIETTNGTIMSPTHIYLQPSRWNYIQSNALDAASNGRPLVVPGVAGPFNAFVAGNESGRVQYEGDTGYTLFGLPVCKDLNIPAPTSGADQCLVGNLQEVYVYEGPQVTRAVPQTLANNLQILLQLYAYIAVLVRYPKAIQQVTGAGLSTITF